MRRTIALMLFPVASVAQPMDDGTVDVYFQQITRQGELEGCSLVFTALARDHAYHLGAQIIMNGSIAVRALDGKNLVFAGKLGTRKWLGTGPGPWEPPVHFHFATRNGSTAKHAKITHAETEGYRLLVASAIEPEVLTLLREIAEDGEFSVGFNRRPGGQDVHSPIKLDVALKREASGNAGRTTNDRTAADFFSCMSRLAQDIKRNLVK